MSGVEAQVDRGVTEDLVRDLTDGVGAGARTLDAAHGDAVEIHAGAEVLALPGHTERVERRPKRRLAALDPLVFSLSSKGLSNQEISTHLQEIYGAEVSAATIGRITDGVLEEMSAWQTRPLDRVYPVVFIDAIVIKIRDGKVANRPVYTAVGVTVDGTREILGLWVGDGSEGAKYWHQVLTEIMNRGVADVCILICDGLKGLPESVSEVWPLAIVQTCVIHLIRNSFRYASRSDDAVLARDLRSIYTSPTEQAARDQFQELTEKWGERYPAIIKLWDSAWPEFVPFLSYNAEIRRVIYSTNAVESLHSQFRRAVRARGYFQTEQAALKCLYLTVRSLDPSGQGKAQWNRRWKAALNAFSITFEGRIELGN